MHKEGDPSVEEILRSIKQVIARDGRQAGSPYASGKVEDTAPFSDERTPSAQPESAGRDDVLDLSALAIENGDADDAVRNAIPDDALIAGAAEDAMRDSLSALVGLSGKGPAPRAEPRNPLEDIVRDMLRPMLREWLDANLPDLIERMVQKEIARITGRA